MIKTAMIMAAGLGTRFGHYTELVPKGFVEVGGKPMKSGVIKGCAPTAFVILFLSG